MFVSVMDAIIKWMSDTYGAVELMFYRSLFGLIPAAIMVALTGGFMTLRSSQPMLQAARAVLSTVTTVLFFLSLRYLPLAEAVALAFAAPIVQCALSGPLLGERVGARRWVAVLVGFIGILVILRPGTSVFTPYALLPLGAAVCLALTLIAGRRLTRTDTGASIVFHTTLGGVAAGALAMPFHFTPPPMGDIPVLVLIGLLGGVGHMFIIEAYKRAEASMLAPIEYTSILWAILLGFAFWSEIPDAPVLAGIAVVSASGIYIARREAIAARGADAPD